jgi:hypothetical protein
LRPIAAQHRKIDESGKYTSASASVGARFDSIDERIMTHSFNDIVNAGHAFTGKRAQDKCTRPPAPAWVARTIRGPENQEPCPLMIGTALSFAAKAASIY